MVHKGPSVAVITEEDAREIYEARGAHRRASRILLHAQASDAEIDKLAASVRTLHESDIASNQINVLQAKNGFYEVLLAGSGNHVLAQMLQQLNNRVTMLRRMTLSPRVGLTRRWPSWTRSFRRSVAEMLMKPAGCAVPTLGMPVILRLPVSPLRMPKVRPAGTRPWGGKLVLSGHCQFPLRGGE